MFSLSELEAASSLLHACFSPTPQYAWPLLAERSGAEVWVKHENHTPTGAFKVRGGLIYLERLHRERPAGPRRRVGDTRQPRPVARVGGATLRRAGRCRGAAWQQRREERRDAGIRCPAGRARRRFRDGARGGGADSPNRGPGIRAILRPRSGEGRRHLCARTVPRRTAARCAVRADRPRLRHLRRDPDARPAGPRDRHRRRAERRLARLRALVRRGPGGGTEPRADACRRHRGARSRTRTPSPSSARALRASSL